MATRGRAPRRAALDLLRHVRSGHHLDTALERTLAGLSPDDRNLARETASGVLRHRRLLDHRIVDVLHQPRRRRSGDLQDLLRIGTYQLLFLDSVPDYAAVGETVAVARSLDAALAPMVNGVLRAIARQPKRVDMSDWTLGERYSHPDWLVNRWIRQFGPERTEEILTRNNQRPATTIIPFRWSTDRLIEALSARPSVSVTRREHGLSVAGIAVADVPGYREGAFLVQDHAQARLLQFAEFDPGAWIWDACAAPGGKALSLARDHRVIASESSAGRIPRLRQNIRRMRIPLPVFRGSATTPPLAPRSVPAVLVDAPCTATGTFARHPEGRWRLAAAHIDTAAERQRSILAGAAATVCPGGLLVYLTCSLETDENEAIVDGFLTDNPDFAREGSDLRLFPSDTGSDGGFGARLRRAA